MDSQNFSNIPTNLMPAPAVVTSAPAAPTPTSPEPTHRKPTLLTIVLGLITAIGIISTIVAISQIVALNQQISNLETELSATKLALENATISYLEIPRLGIRFEYPAGVTDVQYSDQNAYDGAITFTSITKDGVTIDINTCGGKSSYRQNAFSLGQIIRLNPLNGSSFNYNNYEQIARIGDYEFFFAPSSDCAADPDSTDYKIAVATIQDFIDTIEEY